MRKYCTLLLPILVLTACSGNYRVKNIVSFTNQLNADAKGVAITLPKREHIIAWDGEAANNSNIDANDLPTKLKFAKLKLSADISAKPIIIEDKIIVLCTNGSITAFNSNDYSKIWSVNIQAGKHKNTAFGGGILHSDGKLYVTNGSQILEILNPETGRKILSKKFPDIIVAAPVMHKNLVLLLTLGNQLFAIDKNTGTIIWDHAGSPETLTYRDKPGPVIDPMGRVFVAYSSGQIYLLHPENGSVLWKYDLSAAEYMPGFLPVNVTTKPIIEGHNIYVADSTGEFYKFDTQTGNVVWKKPIQDVQTTNNVGNAILITTNGRQAAAIDKTDGRIIWVTDIVDDVKQSILNQEAMAKKQEQEEILAAKPKKLPTKNIFTKLFAKMNSSITKTQSEPKTISGYDRSKLKPIDFVSSILMNDLFTLYTSKGTIYYLSPKDGVILDQKNLKTKLNFVAIADKVVLVSGKKILLNK